MTPDAAAMAMKAAHSADRTVVTIPGHARVPACGVLAADVGERRSVVMCQASAGRRGVGTAVGPATAGRPALYAPATPRGRAEGPGDGVLPALTAGGRDRNAGGEGGRGHRWVAEDRRS